MIKKILLVVLVIAGVAFLINNINSRKSADDVIKIGIILPLTGPGAPYGIQAMEGINTALTSAITQGLIEQSSFKLIVEDSKTETAQGVNAINKLIRADGVQIVIGALASSVTLAIAPIAEREGVLLLSPGSSSDQISEAGDYVFRMAPRDSYDGDFLARAMIKRFGISTVGVLHLDNDFGTGLKDSFVSAFESAGGTVVVQEAFAMGSSDFRSQITKANKATFDALLLIAAGNENVVALKQIKEIGLEAKIFTPSTLNDPKLIAAAGEAAEGVIFSAASFEGIKAEPEVIAFFAALAEEYPDKQPTTFTAYGYDSLMVLLKGIGEEGNSASKVKGFLYSLSDFTGASGPTSFDENGDARKELTLFQVENGEIGVMESF